MNILIIEKNTFKRKLIKEELSYVGYEIRDTSDISGAEMFLQKEVFDLIIIKANKSGFDFVNRFRKRDKRNHIDQIIPIIFISEVDNIELRLESFRIGGNEFIVMSNKGELSMKVNSILKPDLIWRGTNIAIVEDDRVTARFLTYLLKNKGANVNWFSNATDCFSYLKNESVDLIVTDFRMPVMTGTELVTKIRKELGMIDLPIVFTSATKEKAEILEFYKCGGNDFISKPFLKEEIYTKLKILLDSRNKTKVLNQYIKELSNLNDVKDHFLAVCSHDLRAPLNSILGYSDVLIEDDELDPDVTDMIKVMNKSATNLLSMVNDLLVLSEVQLKEELELEEVDLSNIIQDSFSQLKGIMSKDITYTLKNNAKNSKIYGNDSMLRRTFTNLLSNAYKFTKDGGSITSRIWTEGSVVYCTVEDSGIGIPQESLSNIFVSMSGAGRNGLEGQKSTGIGLSIVKEIVEKHKATIDVSSEEGVGTMFTLGFEQKKGA